MVAQGMIYHLRHPIPFPDQMTDSGQPEKFRLELFIEKTEQRAVPGPDNELRFTHVPGPRLKHLVQAGSLQLPAFNGHHPRQMLVVNFVKWLGKRHALAFQCLDYRFHLEPGGDIHVQRQRRQLQHR